MLEPGLTAQVRLVVGDADTAAAMGSGLVPVLSTPRLVALCEEATVAAVTGHLGDGETTVGTRIEIDHHAPTPVGDEVTVTARLDAVDGRRLRFNVDVADTDGPVAGAVVLRAVIDREHFLDSVHR
jgi:fluoroacetyl-CoA thioesterase